MLCPGIPGAGKTMIAAIVVKDLEQRFLVDEDIAVLYLYCNYNRLEEQRASDLFSSLLRQLIQHLKTVPACVGGLFQKHQLKGSKPSTDEVLSALKAVVSTFERVFVVIDALDECDNTDLRRDRLLTEVFNLETRQQSAPHVMATSRYIQEATSRFEDGCSLEIRASDYDVGIYLEGRMPSLPSFVKRGTPLLDQIKSDVIKAVDGMYVVYRKVRELFTADTSSQVFACPSPS